MIMAQPKGSDVLIAVALADIDLCIEDVPLTLDQTILSYSITSTGLYPLLASLGPTVLQIMVAIIMYLLGHKSIIRTRRQICKGWETSMSVMGQVCLRHGWEL